MEQDRTRRRVLSAAVITIFTTGALAGPAAAGGPPEQAPAHGDAPPPQAAQPRHDPGPPPQAPAHGVRGTQPAKPAAANAARTRAAASPSAKPHGGRAKAQHAGSPGRSAAARPAAPASHAPAHGRRGTAPAGSDRASGGPRGGGQPKVTLCHATGSATNPYVTITIAAPAVEHAHDVHQQDGDLIPAPAGGCPTATEDAARQAAGAIAALLGSAPVTSASSGSPPAGAASAPSAPAAGGGVITSSQIGTTPGRDGRIRVLGALQTVDGEDALDVAPTTAARDAGQSLPFTGAGLGLLAAIGLGLTLAGVALRRRSAAPHVA
ncbi:MAG TPA: hypothetical protein VF549_00065 [Solirubrobacteraceae bacterium]|jgi:hypothetical protein